MSKTQKPSAKSEGNEEPKSKAGRPPSITPAKRSIFIAALENGLSIKEALVQAKIGESSYKRLKLSSAAFRTEMEVAGMKLTMMARSKLATAINEGDKPTVRWYLERKVPEEFRPAPGDEGNGNPLPEGTIIILPGSKPHPRIIPEGETK